MAFLPILALSNADYQCPIACQCKSKPGHDFTEWSVVCGQRRYWKTVPYKLPANLTYFRLMNSNLTTLRSGAFRHSDTLRTLKLDNNKMVTIEAAAFKGLYHLNMLSLTTNKLNYLANGTMEDFQNLTILDLSQNEFEEMPMENICRTTHLQVLKLNGNKLKDIRFNECFANFKDLRVVDVSNNPVHLVNRSVSTYDFFALRNSPVSELNVGQLPKLQYLTKDNFKFLPNLTSLNLRGNHFFKLPGDLFADIPQLQSLSLEHNFLKGVPSVATAPPTKLESLSLRMNNIHNLTFPKDFARLTNLRCLSLSLNFFKRLHNDTFRNVPQPSRITDLDLSSCKLESIEADALRPLKSLVTLQLYANYLTPTALQTALYGLRFAVGLREINLDNNNLTVLTEKTFQYLAKSSLTKIRLQKCGLTEVHPGTFDHLPKLSSIDLEYNSLHTIEECTFQGLRLLKSLFLKGNNLNAVPKAGDGTFNSLETLKLEDNHIKHVGLEALKGYSRLKLLYLSNNLIRKLDNNVFRHTPNLRNLRLVSNKL